jgi:N12 class adenine-specific DNA methylase
VKRVIPVYYGAWLAALAMLGASLYFRSFVGIDGPREIINALGFFGAAVLTLVFASIVKARIGFVSKPLIFGTMFFLIAGAIKYYHIYNAKRVLTVFGDIEYQRETSGVTAESNNAFILALRRIDLRGAPSELQQAVRSYTAAIEDTLSARNRLDAASASERAESAKRDILRIMYDNVFIQTDTPP